MQVEIRVVDSSKLKQELADLDVRFENIKITPAQLITVGPQEAKVQSYLLVINRD